MKDRIKKQKEWYKEIIKTDCGVCGKAISEHSYAEAKNCNEKIAIEINRVCQEANNELFELNLMLKE